MGELGQGYGLACRMDVQNGRLDLESETLTGGETISHKLVKAVKFYDMSITFITNPE